MNISDISIERPSAFYACLPLLFAIVFFIARYRHLSKNVSEEYSSRIKRPLFLRTLCFSIAVFMFICAYAGISWGGTAVPVQKNGRAVCFVFDISYSMNAKDTKKGRTRLETASRYAESLMDSLDSASFSVVLAKGNGTVAVPLTEDHEIIRGLLANLSPELMTAGGSSLGKGIMAAINSFPAQSSQAPYIWLFTDGEETDSALLNALQETVKYGIPVTIIGFGSETESEILAGDGKTAVKTALRSDAIQAVINSVQLKNSKNNHNGISFIKAEDKGTAYTLLKSASEDLVITYETQSVKRFALFLKIGIFFIALAVIAVEVHFPPVHKKMLRLFGSLFVITLLTGCSGRFSCGKKILEGRLEWTRKDYHQATVSFLDALDIARQNDDSYLEQYALYGLASTYLMLEENDAATERLSQIAPDASDDVRFAILYDTGLLAQKKGDYGTAVSLFKQALLIDGSDIQAKINLELSLEKNSVQNGVKERNVTSVSEDSEEQMLENAMYSMMREKEKDTWKSQKQEVSESGPLDY
ncbi:MAG: VWA domain-containing protein [Treponema sp.]|nr:VWA domain-containing protein [Treponema sp.]